MPSSEYYDQTGPSNQMQVNILDENIAQPGDVDTDNQENSKESE